MATLIAALTERLGPDSVATGAAIAERHLTDWTGHAPARPLAVLYPRTVEDVAAALRLCHAAGQSVVPQGGMTGLAGGAVPRSADICLSFDRFQGVEEIDPAAATMTLRAGTPLAVAQEAAGRAGFALGLDFGARGSCQIGGNIATNAGGIRVIQNGMTRDMVLGLEVVLADGTVLPMLNKMMKNNTGLDLKQLFIGTEGTLGVVTRAVLKLQPRRWRAGTALIGLADYGAALGLLGWLRQRLAGDLSAFEAMWDDFHDLGVAHGGSARAPLVTRYPLYALIEATGGVPEADAARFEALLAEAFEAGVVRDAVLAKSEAEAAALWRVREVTAEFPIHLDPINFDISLPIGGIGDFVGRCRAALHARWPRHRSFFFGHIGDSNLHVTVDGRSIPGVPHEAVETLVYDLVRDVGGSISAEHGIGLLKRPFLGHSRSPAEIEAMRAIKQALDPKGILNPGKAI